MNTQDHTAMPMIRHPFRSLLSFVITTVALTALLTAQVTPTLTLPSNGAVNQSTTIVLSWSSALGDSAYHLQIDTSSTFGTMMYNDSTLSPALQKVTGLSNARTYYWRVAVRDSVKAGGAKSPFSSARTFTTWNVTPTTPLLPVTLGMTGGFALLSYAGITNTGPSVITGNVGVSPLAGSYMTGFGTPNVVGTIYGVDATGPSGSIPFPVMLTVAMGDLTIAFNDAAGRTIDPIGVSGNLGGRTLYSGLYKSNGSLEITAGDLTLDAQGDVNAVWIFQIASNFNMSSGRQVFLSGGAKASNVFWQTGSAATFGTTCKMKGTILAHTAVTFATGASLEGRAMSRTASVTMQSNTIGGSAGTRIVPSVFLGTAANFRVLAGSRIASTGSTTIAGDIGVSPSTVITGFPPATLTGVKHPGNATSLAAQTALKGAFDSTSAMKVDSTISSELSGLTYTPGVYASTLGTFGITDTLTLDAKGDASAVWVFKMAGALSTASGSVMKLKNGAQWNNVYWQTGTSAWIGANSTFSGNILAALWITVNDGATVNGRLLARTDSVALHSATIGGTAVVLSVPTAAIPQEFMLMQNYPNPFNPSTTIQYRIPADGRVDLTVFDALGRTAVRLVDADQRAGEHSVSFDAGALHLSSGVYLYRLTAGGSVSVKKLVLMK